MSCKWKLSIVILLHDIRVRTAGLPQLEFVVVNSNNPHALKAEFYPLHCIGTIRENTDFRVGVPLERPVEKRIVHRASHLGKPNRIRLLVLSFGDPDAGMPAGTRFEYLPTNWSCSFCGAGNAERIHQPPANQQQSTSGATTFKSPIVSRYCLTYQTYDI